MIELNKTMEDATRIIVQDTPLPALDPPVVDMFDMPMPTFDMPTKEG